VPTKNNTITTYEAACRYLDDLQMHKIKLGLEAMQSILAQLGSPERKTPAVHVAGTNGKGSVCSMLRSVMTEAGYKTGLYTSPHLSSVRERFRIDDRFISEEEFTRLMEKIRSALGGKTITYFECATALAFCWFAEQECDLMVIETGMGGRLDATNVLQPLISVITTISLDHEQYLGDTIELVAFEKAGIIKQGVPVVSGVVAMQSRAVIEKISSDKSAQLTTRDTDFFLHASKGNLYEWKDVTRGVCIADIRLPAGGLWQIENTSCAIAVLAQLRVGGFNISDDSIRQGISKSNWPGRMEYLKLPVTDSPSKSLHYILDGAHNQEGIDHLIHALQSSGLKKRLYLVWASMADKKYSSMLREIAQMADCVLLTRPDSERSASPEDMAKVLSDSSEQTRYCCQTVKESVLLAQEMATEEDLIVVAGSLYLVGEFRKLLVGEVV